MPATRYEYAARVIKPRGLEGEVTAVAAVGLPFCLYEGLEVFAVPPSLYGPRRMVVEAVRDLGGDSFGVRFSGLSSIDDVEELSGCYLLADLDDLDLGEFDGWLIGARVVDERYGELGKVTEYLQTPANDVLVVTGAYGEVLVPIIDEVIVSVPENDGDLILTHVMDGLIEGQAPNEGAREGGDA
ncbi:MAG: ribosome maturation factor RimM [Coriobacteriales bacterium]